MSAPVDGRRRQALSLFLAASCSSSLMLQGCATTAFEKSPEKWTQGRLALRVEATSERAAHSASAAFELRGNGVQGELRLFTPLGTRLATAAWSPGTVQLMAGDQTLNFNSLEALAQHTLGEALPLAALSDWVAARPWPQAAHRNTDTGFEQLGWQVLTQGAAQGLIEAQRRAAPAVVLRIRLEAP